MGRLVDGFATLTTPVGRGGHMKSLKSLFAISAAAMAISAAPAALAVPTYSDTFQGVTFIIDVVDNNTLTLEILGADTATGDWATANFLAAFDLKDLGIDFGTATATANGPGAVDLSGV